MIPILNDGPANAKETERLGFGTSLHWKDITEETLLANIQEVLNNPVYKNKANEWGDLMMDQVQRQQTIFLHYLNNISYQMTKPFDRAIWWLEYLLRHPGNPHMRSPVHNLKWYQFFLLDVIAFLIVSSVSVILVICCLLKYYCCSRNSKSSVDPKKNL